MDIEFIQEQIPQVARKLKAKFYPGDVVGFSGGLAAGKTTLITEIARQFGYEGRVTSPTFVIEHRYPTPGIKKVAEIIHLDLYRLKKEDLITLDWGEYKNQKNKIIFIEWSEKLPKSLLKINKLVKIKIINDKKRRLTLLNNSTL